MTNDYGMCLATFSRDLNPHRPACVLRAGLTVSDDEPRGARTQYTHHETEAEGKGSCGWHAEGPLDYSFPAQVTWTLY